MAKEFVIGVRIGAALQSTWNAAFGGARKTLTQLGQAADQVKGKHIALGAAMTNAMADTQANVGKLHREYQALGRTLDQLKAKHAALGASIAQGHLLQQQRQELKGQARDTLFTGAAMAAPVIGAGKVAADFQDQLRDIAITGEMTAAEEAKLGATIRRAAVQFNQVQSQVGAGIQTLVAGGIQDAAELERFAPILAKTATSTRAGVDDLGAVLLAMRNNLNIQAGQSESALNILAKSGKLGQFEIRDMAKWLPSLAPMFQTLGVQGPKAVAEIGAALQVARMGAGSNDEAANNLRNFLGKITAPDTLKDFDKAGINLTAELKKGIGKGMTPVQAMLGIVMHAVGKDGPKAAKDLQTALKSTNEAERQLALSRLQESTKLGALFQDMQVLNFLRPAMANQDKLKSIQAESLAAGNAAPGQGVIDADFAKRMEMSTEQARQLRIGLTEIGIVIGSTLLPAFNDGVQAVLPMVRQFGAWAEANPGLVRQIVMLGAGLVGAKMGFIALRLGLNLILSPINAVRTGILMLSSKWTLLRAIFQMGNFGAVGRVFSAIGTGAAWLGRVLGGPLLSGLRLAGQAIMIFGRVLMANPIGLAITAIGIAAYLIYKHWGAVKAALTAGWNWIKGLGSAFRQAGADLIQGLINGIMSKVEAAKARILEVGASIKGAFTRTLGIRSPSRVFMGYGQNIVEGARIGIVGSQTRAIRAANDMAAATRKATVLPFPSGERLARANATLSAGRAGGGGSMVVNFSPTIHVQGGTGDVRGQVQAGISDAYREFEANMRRWEAEKKRRAF